MTWVLGVDSGGSGLRAALAPADDITRAETAVSDEPVRIGPDGVDAGHLLRQLLPMVRSLLGRAGGGHVASAVIGAAGTASLGGPLRARLPGALRADLGVRSTALAADGVTAYAGALGQRPGAVVAAGTGVIALGTDLSGWRRADGWGHLLGDAGGGAWIGRAGLEAALRAHDGRRGGSAALLSHAEAAFGPADELPERLYPRPDRPAVLASFAPRVAACAEDDPVAAGILAEAARHIADTAAAVCPPAVRAAGAARAIRADQAARAAQNDRAGKAGQSEADRATRATEQEHTFDTNRGGWAAEAGPATEVGRDAEPGRSAHSDKTAQAGQAARTAQNDRAGQAARTAQNDRACERGGTVERSRATPSSQSAASVEIALTGGLFKLGEPLLAPLRGELAAQLPHTRLTSAAGDPLGGALLLASALHFGDLRLPPHPTLLYLPGPAETAS
ncbi:BadF/BadG/BcrA/BcrD ATPase family protein [Streptomyces sp. HNM0663]|uniref:BadF/BadG/BcrA/BcrD ATPase family protein n=1 Tax=Streptomyces chengmaiensis TaxID=3040919 RepID=A0ABT6HLN1_9ACTN|nr:BadF/BadG/BcrA/BcrD ATPase family protein [Streptomyces chengmaiensis]MDH2388959.1 BadF/BadG/BcrA/BcrD ATPase family protein [Streptomyces chengmaiensis]